MGCVTSVTRILEESKGINKVTFEPKTETFLIEVSAPFSIDEISMRVRQAGKEHDERLGLKGKPDWLVKIVEKAQNF